MWDVERMLLAGVVGLRGGSGVEVSVSTKGLRNAGWLGSNEDFTFILGGRRYQCSYVIARFLLFRVSVIQSIDDTIDEVNIDIDDPADLFARLLSVGSGGSVLIEATTRMQFISLCGTLWNSELYENVCGRLGDEITNENVSDHLRFLSATFFRSHRFYKIYLANH
jgi:hypothetical protein